MKKNWILSWSGLAAIGLITLLSLSACGKLAENKSVKKSEAASYEYDLNDNGCATGKQSFGSLGDYCKGLQEQERNKGCALDSRKRLYESSCKSFGSFKEIVPTLPTGGTPDGDPGKDTGGETPDPSKQEIIVSDLNIAVTITSAEAGFTQREDGVLVLDPSSATAKVKIFGKFETTTDSEKLRARALLSQISKDDRIPEISYQPLQETAAIDLQIAKNAVQVDGEKFSITFQSSKKMISEILKSKKFELKWHGQAVEEDQLKLFSGLLKFSQDM